jgi:hypothetical protein
LKEAAEANNPALRKILKTTSTAVTSRHFFVLFFAFNVNQSILMCFDNMNIKIIFPPFFPLPPFSHLFDFRSKASKMRAEINIIQPRGKKRKEKKQNTPKEEVIFEQMSCFAERKPGKSSLSNFDLLFGCCFQF